MEYNGKSQEMAAASRGKQHLAVKFSGIPVKDEEIVQVQDLRFSFHEGGGVVSGHLVMLQSMERFFA